MPHQLLNQARQDANTFWDEWDPHVHSVHSLYAHWLDELRPTEHDQAPLTAAILTLATIHHAPEQDTPWPKKATSTSTSSTKCAPNTPHT